MIAIKSWDINFFVMKISKRENFYFEINRFYFNSFIYHLIMIYLLKYNQIFKRPRKMGMHEISVPREKKSH